MGISLKLLDPVTLIEKNINAAIAAHMNNKLSVNTNNIINNIKLLIPIWIKNQPEILSLSENTPSSLRGAFGITTDAASIINSITGSIVDSLTFNFNQFDKDLNGGLTINIQPETFQNLLSLPDGHVIYDGGNLHWLQWLLLKGDEIIVAGYQYNPSSGLGRSKLGNMITGGAFRVPPQFSGTVDNNFVTRALNGNTQVDQITKIFTKYLI
jgi:hypothetical protein